MATERPAPLVSAILQKSTEGEGHPCTAGQGNKTHNQRVVQGVVDSAQWGEGNFDFDSEEFFVPALGAAGGFKRQDQEIRE